MIDPCCGSGGMFVQSAKFVENHGGNINRISVFGQDSNPTTWKMAQMNLAIRGIEADLGKYNADIGDTLISNIRPYFKKIVYCYNECGCSSDVLCFTPVHSKYAAYLYSTLYTDILLTSHTLKIGAESIHLLLRFLFCQQVPYLTLSTVERAIYYFNNEPPVRKLNGKPPVLFRTERVA